MWLQGHLGYHLQRAVGETEKEMDHKIDFFMGQAWIWHISLLSISHRSLLSHTGVGMGNVAQLEEEREMGWFGEQPVFATLDKQQG